MNPLKTSDYLKTWALYILTTSVVGFVVALAAGFVLGFALALMKIQLSPSQAQIIGGGVGFLASLPFSFLLFHHFVSRMVERKLGPGAGAPPPLAESLPPRPPRADW